MNARKVYEPQHLRELAAHTRYLAQSAYPPSVAHELHSIAEDFEREATRLGRRREAKRRKRTSVAHS